MLICRILRSCLFCCADCDCWWLVTGVIWGVLGVGALVVEAIWGVAGIDAQIADAVWGGAVYGLIDSGCAGWRCCLGSAGRRWIGSLLPWRSAWSGGCLGSGG